jgi:hypothetical protein
MVHQWLINGRRVRSPIRSLQYGTVSIANTAASGTATINTVDTNNALLIWLGCNNAVGSYTPSSGPVRLAFTNATTITGTRGGTSTAASSTFVVLEYWPGVIKSITRGTIAVSGTSNTAAVAVVKSQSIPFPLGWESNSGAASGELDNLFAELTLTTDVLLTATLGANVSASTITVGYQLVEFL